MTVTTRDKQLLVIDSESAFQKWKDGKALNLKELAVVTGYSYECTRQWKREGLPLLNGKITQADFNSWRKKVTSFESASPTVSRRPSKYAGKHD